MCFGAVVLAAAVVSVVVVEAAAAVVGAALVVAVTPQAAAQEGAGDEIFSTFRTFILATHHASAATLVYFLMANAAPAATRRT
jgi:hypothetical protein